MQILLQYLVYCIFETLESLNFVFNSPELPSSYIEISLDRNLKYKITHTGKSEKSEDISKNWTILISYLSDPFK